MNELLTALLLIATTYSHAGSIQVAEAGVAFDEANALCLKATQDVKDAIRIAREEWHVAKELTNLHKGAKFISPQAQLALNRAMVAYEQLVRAEAKSTYACDQADIAYDKLTAEEQRID